ncbi:hypothetical protein MKX01_033354 [Papaver californicum]|nr:hypothetical protein MKX01_033354 [Papaver californicum]
MEYVSCKWLLLSFPGHTLVCNDRNYFVFFSFQEMALCTVDGVNGGKVRGVKLGNWLFIMQDEAKVQFKSLKSYKYVCAEEGGSFRVVTVDMENTSGWETFRLWRVSQSEYHLRAFKGKFPFCTGQGASVTATSGSPSSKETFTIERSSNDPATSGNMLKVDYVGTPGFDEGNVAIFVITFDDGPLQREYQLSNGYGQEKAKQVLTEHRNNYITREDFHYLSQHSINTVRIPVRCEFGIKCKIDLLAAPGSQNGIGHSSTRDGSIDWMISDNIQQSLDAVEFPASK